MDIQYQREDNLSPDEFVSVLIRSTLAQRRPINEPETIESMLRGASVVITARAGTILVGVSRAITDWAYCTYLSDLAVDAQFQRQGIGKELVRRTHLTAGSNTTLILLAAPAAADYYGHIGMGKHPSCWTIPRQVRG